MMLYHFHRFFLLGALIAVDVSYKAAQASHPGSDAAIVNTNSPNTTTPTTPYKKVFGLYERNGKPAERFELPILLDNNDANGNGNYRTKLPLKISSTQGSLEKRYVSHLKASFLTTIILGLIYRNFFHAESSHFHESGQNIFVLIFTIILYIIEAFTCSTRRYLSNALNPTQVQQYIEKIKLSPPIVTWNIENYHYRTRYYHDDDGHRQHQRTHSKRDKVITSRYTQQYNFQSWKDETEISTLNRLLFDTKAKFKITSSPFIKITISKLLLFTNDKNYYNYVNQENIFRTINKRDMHSDFNLFYYMDGYLPKLLATMHNSDNGSSSINRGLAKSLWFWIFTLCGMTVPYRIWFSRQCMNVDVTLTKEVT